MKLKVVSKFFAVAGLLFSQACTDAEENSTISAVTAAGPSVPGPNEAYLLPGSPVIYWSGPENSRQYCRIITPAEVEKRWGIRPVLRYSSHVPGSQDIGYCGPVAASVGSRAPRLPGPNQAYMVAGSNEIFWSGPDNSGQYCRIPTLARVEQLWGTKPVEVYDGHRSGTQSIGNCA